MKSNNQKITLIKRIEEIENIIGEYGDLSNLSESLLKEYYILIELISRLYMKVGDYQKAIDMMIILTEKILDTRNGKSGDIISKDNIDVEEKWRDSLVSKYLNIGGCLISLKNILRLDHI